MILICSKHYCELYMCMICKYVRIANCNYVVIRITYVRGYVHM